MANIQLLGITVAFVMALSSVSLSFAEIPSIREQLKEGISVEELVCRNLDHNLVLRDNGSPVCVSNKTAEKLEWKIIKISLNKVALIESDDVLPTNAEIEPIAEEIVIEEKESVLILNPDNLLDVIPQDITFDYVLKMPPDDMDSFAEKLVTYANDVITEIEQKELEKKYTTQKGWITIRNQMDTAIRGYALNYVLYERNAIKIDKADEFKNGLYETLGIIFDGTEFTREGVPSSTGISYQAIQQKDEMLVLSNKIKIDFDSGYTLIYIGNWNNNLSELVLYDLEKSEQNGREYALKFEELTESNCDIKFKEIEGYSETTLFILHGRPIYNVFAGTCQVPYMDGHYHWYSSFVDALTGKPLFVKNKSVF